ncbi:lysis protein [Pseudomonas putida]|uniref:lysis protein n=1 Tax=Pseudomonas putida TaxID=303 RepID=UPI0035A4428B
MKALDWRLAVLALVLGIALGGRGSWLWQSNSYGKKLADQAASFGGQLADQDRQYARERDQASAAALDQLKAHQDARRALEARLQEQESTHYKELTNAQNDRNRLRDRLATADLRLSVLLDAGAFAGQGGDGGLREAAGTGSVVHGSARAQLDPAHAQRIVGITGDGDDGLKALQACQAYVLEVTQ